MTPDEFKSKTLVKEPDPVFRVEKHGDSYTFMVMVNGKKMFRYHMAEATNPAAMSNVFQHFYGLIKEDNL